MNWAWLPWTRKPDVHAEQSDNGQLVRLLTAGGEPAIDQIGMVLAACRTYGTALAAMAPDSGPVTPELMFDCGCHLGRFGRWQAFIDVRADGTLRLTPFDAWANNGQWEGNTRERAGRASRHLTVPDDAVVAVGLPGGPPLGALSSTASIHHANERAIAQDATTPNGRVITMGLESLNIGSRARAEIAQSVEDARGGVMVLPAGTALGSRGSGVIGPDPSQGSLELRKQLRTEVEALFGIQGLLSDMDAAAVNNLWRVASVRTFGPMARLVEDEAARKLDAPVRLNRRALIAAPVSEVARSVAQRAMALERMVNAGVGLAEARAAAGL